jgi:single-stranded DNA-binding protein
MGKIQTQLMDVRIASDITFTPGADPKHNHAMFTVINNRGKKPGTQEEQTDEITCHCWGKYAGVISFYGYKGKQINIIGRIQSYSTETGRIKRNGKKEIFRKDEVVVDHVQLLGDSMKMIEQRVARNIADLITAGRTSIEGITAAELLKHTPPQIVDFSPANCPNGRYGYARVWTKDRGFWDQGAGGAAYQPMPVSNGAVNVNALQAQLAELSAKLQAATGEAAAAAANTNQNLFQI